MKFINRTIEFAQLDRSFKKLGFLVCYGRRRIGKTRLIKEWLKDKENVLYTQAIVSSPSLQLEQIFDDIKGNLETKIQPKNWSELFEILGHSKKKLILCIDEFPYLVEQDPSLPSVFQKWIDHSKTQIFFILSGSSQRMMNDIFLKPNASLFGRADSILHIEPMSYREFLRGTRLPKSADSFALFSIVGGVPKYWEAVESETSPEKFVAQNFFASGAIFESEPDRILLDEKVNGIVARTVLDCIGKGSHKLSEIAARMQTPATNLTRVMELLRDSSLIERQHPFGENGKSSKRSLYRISDPCLRFWYNVYSPHLSRWHLYSLVEKNELMRLHASTVFEDVVRSNFPHAARYWEPNCEFDCVYLTNAKTNEIVIVEAKYGQVTRQERVTLENNLKEKFLASQLSKKYQCKQFKVITLDDYFAW